MVLPLIVIGLDVFFAAIMAYGTHPNLAQFSHGLDLILISRRFQWLLVAAAMLLAIILIAMVVSAKRRAWWLIGLAPVLALFFHRFSTDSFRALEIIENPTFITAQQAGMIRDEDEVVGLIFADVAYAYPYAALFAGPVVIQSDHDRRMILFWSCFANRAQAFEITRELKGRDLEIVSMPANALLVYNSRLGQFINGLTGLTQPLGRQLGDKPAGVRDPIRTWKTSWSTWRSLHPQTLVLQSSRPLAHAPTAPVLPHYKLPREPGESSNNLRIAMIQTLPPLALPENAIADKPLNLTAAGQTVLVYRDPRSGALRAFDRRIEQDLFLRFVLNTDTRRPKAFVVDTATNTAWNSDGTALDGTRKGAKLTPIPTDDSLYWPVMKYWYPDLSIITPHAADTAAPTR